MDDLRMADHGITRWKRDLTTDGTNPFHLIPNEYKLKKSSWQFVLICIQNPQSSFTPSARTRVPVPDIVEMDQCGGNTLNAEIQLSEKFPHPSYPHPLSPDDTHSIWKQSNQLSIPVASFLFRSKYS